MNNFDAGVHFTIFYLSIALFSLLYGAFGSMSAKKRKIYLFLVFSTFAFLMGFRAGDMGSDTGTYITLFDIVASTDSILDYLRSTDFESGYIIYCWILAKLSGDAQILFIVTAAFVCFSIGRFVYKYVDNPGLFCCLFVGMMQFDFFFSAMRQSISVAIFLFAIDYLFKRKPLPFFLICLLAVTFHNSAIAFFLIYPFVGKANVIQRKSAAMKLSFHALAFIISLFFDSIFGRVISLFPKYSYYLGGELMDGEPRLALILKIIISVMLLAVPKLFPNETKTDLTLYRTGSTLSFVNIGTLIMATNATMLSRFSSCFALFSTMHYSNLVCNLKSPRDRAFLIMTTLVAFYLHGLVIVLLKTPEWQTTYPINLIF